MIEEFQKIKFKRHEGEWLKRSTKRHGTIWQPIDVPAKNSAYQQWIRWLNANVKDYDWCREYTKASRWMRFNKEPGVVWATRLITLSNLDSDPVSKDELLQQLKDRGIDVKEYSWIRWATAIEIAQLMTGKVYATEPLLPDPEAETA